MRLLVDCHCFDYPTPQGINTYLRGIYSELIPIATNIEFFLAAADTDNLKRIFGEHPNVHYVKIEHGGSLKRLLKIFPTAIKENKIDWAHFQYVTPFVKNCKTIVTLHDILFEDFPEYFPLSYRLSKSLLFKYSAKRADLLLTVSNYSRNRISAHYKIKESDIKVTPNAVSDVFSKIGKEEARKYVKKHFGLKTYVLYVSRMEPRKDQYGLIQAYLKSNLILKGIDLAIVGDQSLKDARIEELLSSISKVLKDHIHFLPSVTNEELYPLYRGASLFVYPSKAEGFGIPPLEAAVAEIPVICNKATAMGDYDFFEPYLIDTEDYENLAAKMDECIDNPASEERLREIMLDVMDRYNWASIATEFHSTLKGLK